MQNTTSATSGRRALLLLVTGLLLLAFGWILTGESVQAKAGKAKGEARVETEGESAQVAIVDGQPITEAELELAAKEQLEQIEIQRIQAEIKLDSQRYETLRATLDRVIEERLLAKEAATLGTTPEALVESEVMSAIEPVTDEDVAEFYESLKGQGRQLPPQEQIAGQIRQHLESQASGGAREAYMEGLRDKYAVEVSLEAPRVDIETDGSHPATGPQDAPVTLVEFSDFQCPYCSRIVPAIEQVKETYGDKVRIVFRQFPLRSLHPNAQKAAEASLCAHDQGKFWQMHDLMFEEQDKLDVAALKDKATRLELDTQQFAQCLDAGKYQEQVQQDVRAGVQAGVGGTPAVFINGRFLNGAQPFEALAQVIDEELDEAGS